MSRRSKGIKWAVGVVLLVLAMFTVIHQWQQHTEATRTIENLEQQNRRLSSQMNFLQEQARFDSLLLQGDVEKALELYEQHHERAGSTMESMAAVRLAVARKIKQLNQQINRSDFSYAREIEQQQDSLVRLEDSLQIVFQQGGRQRDSLIAELQVSLRRIQQLKEELERTPEKEFLSFTSSKGNEVLYIGEVQNGQAHGQGIGVWLTGSRYEGEWKNNQRHGKGHFAWADGQRYVGEYKNDLRHGQGTYYWPNGEKYVGEWKNDKRSGHGTFFNSEEEVLTEGLWKDDKMIQVDTSN